MIKLGKYKIQEPDLLNILKYSLMYGKSYDSFYMAQNDGAVDYASLRAFLLKVYTMYYKKQEKDTKLFDKIFGYTPKILRHKELSIQNINIDSFIENVVNGEYYNKYRLPSKEMPFLFQSGQSASELRDGKMQTYIHIFPYGMEGKTGKIDCRLYVNLGAKNVLPFASQLLDKCKDKNMYPYFKFYTQANKSDNFVIYSSYENVESMVDVLEDIKKQYPNLLNGTTSVNPMLGKIDDWIGFGEQPTNPKDSYNSIRSKVIFDFVQNKKSDITFDRTKHVEKGAKVYNQFVEHLKSNEISEQFCLNTNSPLLSKSGKPTIVMFNNENGVGENLTK